MSSLPTLDDAIREASAYRVLPSPRGFNVWHFKPWSSRQSGWRIIVADVKTSADGWIHVLNRLGLTQEEPPKALPPPDPSCVDLGDWI